MQRSQRTPVTCSVSVTVVTARWYRRDSASRAGPAPDTVNRTSGRLPRVVRGARAERRRVGDDPWVSPDLLGPLRVPEEVGVVAHLPDEDQVSGSHVLRDERAPGRRTWERVRPHAEPTP